VRSILPGPLEHFIAYAAVAAIAMAGYGSNRGDPRIISALRPHRHHVNEEEDAGFGRARMISRPKSWKRCATNSSGASRG
jgi:hypothetical protein